MRRQAHCRRYLIADSELLRYASPARSGKERMIVRDINAPARPSVNPKYLSPSRFPYCMNGESPDLVGRHIKSEHRVTSLHGVDFAPMSGHGVNQARRPADTFPQVRHHRALVLPRLDTAIE